MVKTFYQAKMEQELKSALLAEQDYELATLHEAIQSNGQAEIDRSKKRLAEIHTELEELK